MDKNTITGFALIALVLIGFNWYAQPSQEEIAQMREEARQDSIMHEQKLQQVKQEEERKTLELMAKAQDSTSLFFESRGTAGEEVLLSNGLVNLTLNTRGGSIQSVDLTEYKNQQKENVHLLRQGMNTLSYVFAGKDDNINTRDFTFKAVNRTDSTVTMRLGDEQAHLDINYRLLPESYVVKIGVQAVGMGKVLHPSTRNMSIDWYSVAAQQEKGFDFEQQYSALTYRDINGDTEKLSETSDENETAEYPVEWVAFKNQFFSCVLVAPDNFHNATLHSTPCQKGSGDLKKYSAKMECSFDPTGAEATEMSLYVGPNDFHILKDHDAIIAADRDLELEDLVYLGWPLFRIINRWFILPLFDFLSGFGMNMGIVLLLLTIIVKAVVYPTTRKSYLSGARMRVLKPKVDAINAKYPKAEDAMQKQTEMMMLYREYGVSPVGGCLPMMLQMPIWIALFNFVPNAIELRGERFLWAEDLSAYDSLISWDADLWLIGDHLSIFCLLFCLTNIANTWISMRQQQSQLSGEQAQQMKMMQYMMYIMPMMFFFMFNNYSSGLCYYYFLSGLTSILIMWFLRKTTDDQKLLARMEEYRQKHKDDPKNTGNLMAKMQALQKLAEEQQQKRNNAGK